MLVVCIAEEEQLQPDMLVDAQDTTEQGGSNGRRVHDVPGIPGRPTVQSQEHPALRANLWAQLREHGRQGNDRGENACFVDHVVNYAIP